MSNQLNEIKTDKQFVKNAVEAAIRIGLIFLLVIWSYEILNPFLVPVLWGAIIAISIAPIVVKVEVLLNAKRSIVATFFTIFALALLAVPVFLLSDTMVDNLHTLATSLQNNEINIPMPEEKVKEIPVIGNKLYDVWALASENIEHVISKFSPQIKMVGASLLKLAGGILSSVLQFIVAIIIAGIFIANKEGSIKVTHVISKRVFGDKGVEWVDLSAKTIRSVVQGILGIAIIQATLAALGLYVIDMPAAGLLSLLVLFVAIIQLPPILILGPAAAYVFSYTDSTSASIFLVYSILVSMSDGFLKPLLLGRGVNIPMLVILIGAIGGMVTAGIIGLFLGSVILALAYKLFVAWLNENPEYEKV